MPKNNDGSNHVIGCRQKKDIVVGKKRGANSIVDEVKGESPLKMDPYRGIQIDAFKILLSAFETYICINNILHASWGGG